MRIRKICSIPRSTWRVFLALYMQYMCATQWTYIVAHCTTLRYTTSHYTTVHCRGIASEIHTCMRIPQTYHNVFLQLCIPLFITFSVTFLNVLLTVHCRICRIMCVIHIHAPTWRKKNGAALFQDAQGTNLYMKLAPAAVRLLSAWGNLPLEIL